MELTIVDEEGVQRALRDYRIDADKHKLSQVFRNLISNALKFTPEGGTVSVTVSLIANNILSDSLHNGTLHKSAMPSLYIQVTDTGHGLDKVRT